LTCVLDIRLAARDRLGVVGIDNEDVTLLLEQIEHRTPVHAPHNVAKALREWEYAVEILRIHLRARPSNEVHLRKDDSVPEGSATQGSGVAHVQRILPAIPETGGHGHV
jgi:hypothetical protein